MKKIIVSSLFMFSISFVQGQIADLAEAVGTVAGKPSVVHDPINELNLVKSLDEARKTYTAIEKQLELLEKAKEQMQKVNNIVREVRYVDEIHEIYSKTIELNKNSLKLAQELNVINDKYIVNLIGTINNSLISFESTLNLVTHLIEDDFFKMNDSERLQRMIDIRNETRDYRATALYLNQEIRRYASVKFLEQIYTRALPNTSYKLKK